MRRNYIQYQNSDYRADHATLRAKNNLYNRESQKRTAIGIGLTGILTAGCTPKGTEKVDNQSLEQILQDVKNNKITEEIAVERINEFYQNQSQTKPANRQPQTQPANQYPQTQPASQEIESIAYTEETSAFEDQLTTVGTYAGAILASAIMIYAGLKRFQKRSRPKENEEHEKQEGPQRYKHWANEDLGL